jgi:hypothetical protein
MSAEQWTPLYEYGPMRVEGPFEPPSLEAIDLYDPQSTFPTFAVALMRWSSGIRVRASCINGGCLQSYLPQVVGLDGRSRFTGPIISHRKPQDNRAIMAHVQNPDGSDVFIIRAGYKGRCGIYDIHLNPFGYIDEEDKKAREEALHHTQERDTLKTDLEAASQRTVYLESLLSHQNREIDWSHEQIEILKQKIKELEAHGGVSDQSQFDLLVLGLGGIGFNQLPTIDQSDLLSLMEKELYRTFHPDRLNGLDRDTTALKLTATEIIQLKIAAIQRLKNRYTLVKR